LAGWRCCSLRYTTSDCCCSLYCKVSTDDEERAELSSNHWCRALLGPHKQGQCWCQMDMDEVVAWHH